MGRLTLGKKKGYVLNKLLVHKDNTKPIEPLLSLTVFISLTVVL